MAAAQNIVSYIMTHDGIPVIYYGEEQHLDGGTEPYTNRAALWEYDYDEDAVLYKLIASLNLLRRHVGRNFGSYLTTESETIDIGENTIAFAKGGDGQPKVISVFNNKGADADDFKVDLCNSTAHGYSNGDELMDVVACKSVTVGDDSDGCIQAWISDGEPVVLFKKSELSGSTLCGIEGESDVELEELYVQSTTITATASDGQLTVIHSATTMPWADAPASATASSTPSGSASATSTSGASAARSQSRYAMFGIALTVAMVFLR